MLECLWQIIKLGILQVSSEVLQFRPLPCCDQALYLPACFAMCAPWLANAMYVAHDMQLDDGTHNVAAGGSVLALAPVASWKLQSQVLTMGSSIAVIEYLKPGMTCLCKS